MRANKKIDSILICAKLIHSNRRKMSLIEIDKRGLFTAVGFLALILIVAYIDFFTTAYVLAKVGITIGGLGTAFLWFRTVATIQQGEEEQKRKEDNGQINLSVMTHETMP